VCYEDSSSCRFFSPAPGQLCRLNLSSGVILEVEISTFKAPCLVPYRAGRYVRIEKPGVRTFERPHFARRLRRCYLLSLDL